MPRFNIKDYPKGYGVRDRDPEKSMATGAQRAVQQYAKRASYNASRRKSNGGNGG